MTDGQALLGRILEEARSEARAIVDAARSDAASRTASARQRVAALEKEARERTERNVESMERTAASNLTMERKRIALASRERLYAAVIGRALALAEARRNGSDYRSLVRGWVAEAAAGLGGRKARVQAGSGEAALVDDRLLREAAAMASAVTGEDIALSFDPAPLSGQGIMLRDDTGRRAWDNRVKTRLKRRESEIRRLVTKLLTEETT